MNNPPPPMAHATSMKPNKTVIENLLAPSWKSCLEITLPPEGLFPLRAASQDLSLKATDLSLEPQTTTSGNGCTFLELNAKPPILT